MEKKTKEPKPNVQLDPFTDWAHRVGRRFLIAFIVYMLAMPLILCAVYDCFPSIQMMLPGLITILIIMVPTAIAEVGSYTPILGSSSYLTFATGNLMNLKMPCVLNAQKIAGVDQGTTEGDAIALIATAVSSIVTIVVMALGMLLIVQLQPLLENENVKTASDYIMPALFGCMALSLFGKGGGKTYVKNRLLSVALPAVLVSVLAIIGVATTGSASWLMLVMIPLSILCARILWKKGIIKVVPNEDAKKETV
jgi:hypothetical protein